MAPARKPKATEQRSIPALRRGLKLIRRLAAAGDEGLAFSHLQRRLNDLPAPTLSRLLKSLAAEGYVVKTAAGLYSRGPELDALGQALGGGGTVESLAVGIMNAFSRETGESVAFSRFYGDRLVIVAKVEVRDSFKLGNEGLIFQPAPWEGPTVVAAAHLSDRDWKRFVRSPRSRIESMAEFRKLCAACRKTGSLVEPLPGRPVRGGPRRACVAVLGADGRSIGTLHSVCPGAHFAANGRKIVTCLQAAAEQLSATLATNL